MAGQVQVTYCKALMYEAFGAGSSKAFGGGLAQRSNQSDVDYRVFHIIGEGARHHGAWWAGVWMTEDGGIREVCVES